MDKVKRYNCGSPDSRFKLFHDLMPHKVEQVLLVSSTYDAWMMEEDCRLSECIINEYHGLNLSKPPRLHWVSSHDDAMAALAKKHFDLVITIVGTIDARILEFGRHLNRQYKDLPSTLLCHDASSFQDEKILQSARPIFDQIFCWSGNTDLLLAIIKSVEDRKNILADTMHAGIRVILLVEDSPVYISTFLPILYRELVSQVQSVMDEGLNEEHRLLTMRARPKILVANSYDEALEYYKQFEPYILGVISDVRYPRNGHLCGRAGIELLKLIHQKRFDIPLLLVSSELSNENLATDIPATFISKHSQALLEEIHDFFINRLGFGPFVFKTPDGREISRATNLHTIEQQIPNISQEAFTYHCNRNDFSRWFFARAEVELADKVRPNDQNTFPTVDNRRLNLLKLIRELKTGRQKGLVVNFEPSTMEMNADFYKIGKGSLGGKARGLAFVSRLLANNEAFLGKYASLHISIPKTLVITTEGFDEFIETNSLKPLAKSSQTDAEIAGQFLQAPLPQWIVDQLCLYLSKTKYPLAVRSSGLLEDAQNRAYAGLYKTYMLSNDNPDFQYRLEELCCAVKLVYASTYFRNPKRFAQRVGHRTEEEKMAVIVQQLIGQAHRDLFYPAISGVAQSYNYYPFSRMKPEDGIVSMVAGLGKTVMQGGQSLRFSPRYPKLASRSTDVDNMLKELQGALYALRLKDESTSLTIDEDSTLAIQQIAEAADNPVISFLCGTYLPDEHRIRDSRHRQGVPVLTFANLLKYDGFPLSQILTDILRIGQEAMGCPVEIEFSVNLCLGANCQPDFAILQMRPMSARDEHIQIEIAEDDVERAFCFTTKALGNGETSEITDIVYVKPDCFDAAYTVEMARQVSRFNREMQDQDRKYLLLGPGRWGSADRWLGIPVSWSDISSVGAIIETVCPQLNVEPSQGSHFFHNLTSLGIPYLNVTDDRCDSLHWDWLSMQATLGETRFIRHTRLVSPLTLKIDGRSSKAVVLLPREEITVDRLASATGN